MAKQIIRVINPNSNQAVTDSMAAAMSPLRMAGAPEIDCVTIENGPFGVASDADIEAAAPLVRDLVARDAEAEAFVIACYSDPGLALAREVTDKPVFGMGECAVLTALALGGRFGVISVSDWSVARHKRQLSGLSLDGRCAGDRALGMSVAETEGAPDALEKIARVGKLLRGEDGADVLITACAGMAKHRRALERAVGIPVVEPVLAATTLALGAVRLADGR